MQNCCCNFEMKLLKNKLHFNKRKYFHCIKNKASKLMSSPRILSFTNKEKKRKVDGDWNNKKKHVT